MSLVEPKKPEKLSVPNQKPPINHPEITFKINRKFTIIPTDKRKGYVKLLDRMIKRVEKIINAKKTDTIHRLRAMNVLSDLIRTSYTMIRDEEVQELEREIEELEKEASEATEGEDTPR